MSPKCSCSSTDTAVIELSCSNTQLHHYKHKAAVRVAGILLQVDWLDWVDGSVLRAIRLNMQRFDGSQRQDVSSSVSKAMHGLTVAILCPNK